MTEAAKIALEEKRHKEIAGLLSEVKAAVMSKKDNAGLEQLHLIQPERWGLK